MLGQDRLGVELDALDVELPVAQAHDHPVLGAVTSSTSGTESAATTSEWYRVASSGDGSPAKTPPPSWWIAEVLPCMIAGARTTSPP